MTAKKIQEEEVQEMEDALSDPDEIHMTLADFYDCDEPNIGNFNE